MATMAIICNGDQPGSIYPTFVLASTGVASGDDVILFFTPGGANALRKGVLEDIRVKGMPPLMELVEGVVELGGRLMFCELGFEVKGIKEEDLREGVEVVGAATFLNAIKDANITFSF